MATTLYLCDLEADVSLGSIGNNLRGTAGVAFHPSLMRDTRDNGVVAGGNTNTVAGTTPGVEAAATGLSVAAEWISLPLAADVTISGDITANIWAAENNMSANVAINVIIEIVRSDGSIVEVVRSTRVTEVAVTTRAVNNFTTGMLAADYTEQTANRGDRLRVRVFGDDAGTMNSGFTFNISYGATSGGVDGDTFITFTENMTFETDTTPNGSTIYFTDTASDVATASVDREAWTSRGAGVQSDVVNTATGPTAPIQLTDSAGGTVVDWFTKQLAGFTLGGMAQANLRGLESNASANATLRIEIARVDADGTNPTVWASWCIARITSDGAELGTTESARTAWPSGDDLVISDGQRLRLRVYIDDSTTLVLATGHTVTFFYAGTSGGASGDSYIVFPQTLTEYTPPTPRGSVNEPMIVMAPEGLRTQRRWAG